MKERRVYTKEFKESAVGLYHKSGKTLQEVSEGLGIPPENLRRWVRESHRGEAKGIKIYPGQGNPRDEEMARLKKRVADLEQTNEILKKAMAFFEVKNPR